VQSGLVLKIEILDHIIIGAGDRYYSLKALGLETEPTPVSTWPSILFDGFFGSPHNALTDIDKMTTFQINETGLDSVNNLQQNSR